MQSRVPRAAGPLTRKIRLVLRWLGGQASSLMLVKTAVDNNRANINPTLCNHEHSHVEESLGGAVRELHALSWPRVHEHPNACSSVVCTVGTDRQIRHRRHRLCNRRRRHRILRIGTTQDDTWFRRTNPALPSTPRASQACCTPGHSGTRWSWATDSRRNSSLRQILEKLTTESVTMHSWE